MRRLLLVALFALLANAQRTFQNTQFDISGDLPVEDPTVLAQAEGVATHVNKNELKPVKLQKPAELAVAAAPSNPQGPAAVQPLPLPGLAPQPAPAVASLPQPAPAPALPAPMMLPAMTLPTPAPMPSFAPFTLPAFTFPSHPPLPTLAPFTLPTLPPHSTPAPFTFPTPAPAPGAAAVAPESSDYDEPAQRVSPTTVFTTPAPTPAPQIVQQVPQQQQTYYTPEYVQWVAANYPEYYRQNYQYFQQQYQYYLQSHAIQQPPQPVQAPVQQPQIPANPIVFPPAQPQAVSVHMQPSVAAGVSTVTQGPPPQTGQRPQLIKLEQQEQSGTSPSRASNWFREQTNTGECKKDLKKVAKLFKAKFPAYLQKGGKDAALADLVEKRLIECDEKSTTGHWDKVDSLLTKVQLSKSEESDCRSGLIQERISCQNLLNFSCQFTNSNYQFKLVPARIVIQEARQAEGGAEKCRKVVRLVKKRLEG